jgi:putative spermidine/putrescine transport system permease protein
MMDVSVAAHRKIRPGWLLVAPLLALVLALFLGPIINVLWLSVSDPKPGLDNYAKLFTSDSLARIIVTTLRVCVVTTVLSVLLGYSIAYAMNHIGDRKRNLMLSLLLVSFWISVLVRTFSWLMLLGRNGLVNNGLEGIGLISEPIAFMRNELGVLIGMVHYMVPYAVLPILASMQNIDKRVLAASRNLGASGGQTFRRIYLPLTKPGLVAAALLVFILCLGFYVTPAVLGGGKVLMVAEYISVQILVTLRWGTAAMLAALLLFGVLALLFIMSRFMKLSTIFGGAKA